MAHPNLFLIGAAKGGSSTLAYQLASHPEIGMAAKEPNIFNQPDLDACRARLAKYDDNGLDQRWVLDGSVNYSQYPKFTNVPQNIQALTDPDAIRFVYMMRNPVDRAISQYFWRRERFGEDRPLEEACAPTSVYVMSSRYDLQIDQYLAVFAPAQLFFVKHESYYANVAEEYAALCRWLGVSDTHQPDVALRRGATRKDQTRTSRFPLLNRALRASPRLRKELTSRVPYKYQKKLSQALSVTAPRPEITADQRRFLLTHFTESIDRTEALTGLDLSDWRR